MTSRAERLFRAERLLIVLIELFSALVRFSHANALYAEARSPAITTARGAHDLSLEDAAKSYPVRLHAVATYYQFYPDVQRGILFAHDSTGSVFVRLDPPLPRVRPGDLLDLTGMSAPGDFAPIVIGTRVRVLRASHLPPDPLPVSLTQLLTGKLDGQWVEVEGVVHSIRKSGVDVDLMIATSDGSLRATCAWDPGADFNALVDATVKIAGNAAPTFNRSLQLTGARLLFAGMREVRVQERPTDLFSQPVVDVSRLLRFNPNMSFRHRAHVRGRVTFQSPGKLLCIDSSRQGLCVQTSQMTRFSNGDWVDAVGFPSVAGVAPTLTDSTVRFAGHGPPVPALPVSAEQALKGDNDAKLVRIEGKLVGKDRASQDPAMILSSGNFIFPVVLPPPPADRPLPVWEDGATLRITGICSVRLDADRTAVGGFSRTTGFSILLRSPDDVIVIRKPSWWTPAHLLPILAMVLAIALFIIGWVGVLRHRVAEQASVIQDQNTALRKLSFQDGLTGIPNRRKFDETLESEYGRAARAMTPVSLLMVDIDHFKALNDTYGHQRGDECLVQVAKALVASSVRKTDTVARYGGEEFAVVLPNCDETEAIAVAERMRAAVFNLQIENAGSPIYGRVSISVGVATTLPASGTESSVLIAIADEALYQSKLQGRNRTTSSQAVRIDTRRPEPAGIV